MIGTLALPAGIAASAAVSLPATLGGIVGGVTGEKAVDYGLGKLADATGSNVRSWKDLTNEYLGWSPTLQMLSNPGTLLGGGIGAKGVQLANKAANHVIRMDMPRFGHTPTTQYYFKPGYVGMNGGGIQSGPISYGYNREKVAKAASQEFGQDMSTRRPILYRMANEDNILADALDQVKSGKSETRFGTGNRTMIEPEPHSVLTGTYLDLKTGQPTVRGVGLLGTKPVPVTPLEGSYKSSGRFGNMVSVTDILDGAGKYGFRNYSEIEDYLNTLGLNNSQLKYAKDVISRLKSFDSQIQFGTETTQGLIPKNMRNTPEFQQYAKDHLELSDILSGNLNWGAKNQRVIFNAPKSRSIITGESDNPGFATRTASINMPLKDFSGNEFKQFMDRGVPKSTWPNGMVVEDYLAKYNSSPEFQRTILSSKNNPMVQFPLHFRGTGPNPIPGMTTMQVSGIKPTLRKGGKINVQKLKIFNK